MQSTLKVWTGLGLATALMGAGLAGCAGEAGEGEGGEGAQTAQAGDAGEGEAGEDGEGKSRDRLCYPMGLTNIWVLQSLLSWRSLLLKWHQIASFDTDIVIVIMFHVKLGGTVR